MAITYLKWELLSSFSDETVITFMPFFISFQATVSVARTVVTIPDRIYKRIKAQPVLALSGTTWVIIPEHLPLSHMIQCVLSFNSSWDVRSCSFVNEGKMPINTNNNLKAGVWHHQKITWVQIGKIGKSNWNLTIGFYQVAYSVLCFLHSHAISHQYRCCFTCYRGPTVHSSP